MQVQYRRSVKAVGTFGLIISVDLAQPQQTTHQRRTREKVAVWDRLGARTPVATSKKFQPLADLGDDPKILGVEEKNGKRKVKEENADKKQGLAKTQKRNQRRKQTTLAKKMEQEVKQWVNGDASTPVKVEKVKIAIPGPEAREDFFSAIKPTKKQATCKRTRDTRDLIQGRATAQGSVIRKAKQIVCKARERQIARLASQYRVSQYEWRRAEQYAKGGEYR